MYPGNFHYKYTDLYFTTATVKNWKHLLRPDKYKKIIVDSLIYLAKEQTVRIHAFVIMPNHFHLIWQMIAEQSLSKVQLRFMKYIAQQIKFDLIDHHPDVLEHFKVDRKDREYQFFKERPLSVPLFTDSIVSQKMDYIHRNPIQPKWNLAEVPEAYPWSSAGFYLRADMNWFFLTHFWYGSDWPPPFE
ncbi:MAG: transposase [Saprospiraceae bacterium]|nr:transposase [Saprospiraceae bacterium]